MIDAIKSWQRASWLLTLAFWVNVALAVGAVVAMPFDHRHILGLNPWVKPLKFDLSVMIFLFTAAVLLRLLGEGRARLRGLIGGAIGVAMIFENGLISMQSLRGVRSHMNYASGFDAAVFAVMGVFILLNTVAVTGLLVSWCVRVPQAVPRALRWGIRLGLLAFLLGSVEGFLMVGRGAHTLGAEDGGPGLPFVNWSLTHGDLRVAHFFALHALQAMMLLGWGLSRVRWPERAQVAAVGVAFVGYMGAVWMLFAQAMAGRPVVR